MTNKPRRGGARPNAGRPPVNPREPSKNFSIKLPLSLHTRLQKIPRDRIREALQKLAGKKK